MTNDCNKFSFSIGQDLKDVKVKMDDQRIYN